APASAQVLISEINFTPHGPGDDRWIELVNLSPDAVSLEGWSLYHATATAGMPQTYWWGFPAGTAIPGHGYLRVHWFEAMQPATPTDLWTGRSVHHFLFGLGGESLDPAAGALALLDSDASARMNDPAVFRDFVQWGRAGLRREALAVQRGLWTAGAHTVAPTHGESLALDYQRAPDPTPAGAWFLDPTPTPLGPNTGDSGVFGYGHPCVVGTFATPSLAAEGRPLAGSPTFALGVHGTEATKHQLVVLLLSPSRESGAVGSSPLMSCPLWVGVADAVALAVPATPGSNRTRFALALTGIGPLPLPIHAQGFVLATPPSPWDHAATGGLEI